MIGYRDRTWCGSPNCQNKCGRKFTEEDRASAVEWWGGEDFPLAVSNFCDEEEPPHDGTGSLLPNALSTDLQSAE